VVPRARGAQATSRATSSRALAKGAGSFALAGPRHVPFGTCIPPSLPPPCDSHPIPPTLASTPVADALPWYLFA